MKIPFEIIRFQKSNITYDSGEYINGDTGASDWNGREHLSGTD
jgi:hypothetical protein